MLKKIGANLLFRGDVQVSSMLILRNSKSLLGIPIKILFVVSVLSGARSHSVRYRVQDLYVQLFQLKNNVFERSFQILLIVFPSTNTFFFFVANFSPESSTKGTLKREIPSLSFANENMSKH